MVLTKREFTNLVNDNIEYSKDEIAFQRALEQCKHTTFSYTCDETKCDFETAKKEMKQSAHLKALGVPSISRHIVNSISENEDMFCARDVKGYMLNSFKGNTRNVAVLQNNTYPKDGRIGEIGVLAVEHHARVLGIIKENNRDKLIGAGILTTVVGLFVYAVKKC
jgi:hypothetical protein